MYQNNSQKRATGNIRNMICLNTNYINSFKETIKIGEECGEH